MPLTDPFLTELCKRSTQVPAMAASGRVCVKIDLHGCPSDYATKLEALVKENSDLLQIRIRGIDYYVELLSGDTLLDALSRAKA